MTSPAVTKNQIIRILDDLPPENLVTIAEFVEFLKSKIAELPRPTQPTRRVVKLGGLWQDYTFAEDEIRAARREAWAGLGQGFDG
jgi:hypothetical protein